MDFRWFTAAVLVFLLTCYAPLFPVMDMAYDVPGAAPVAAGPCWVELPEWVVPEWEQPPAAATYDERDVNPSHGAALRLLVLVTSEDTVLDSTHVVWWNREEYLRHRYVRTATWAGWAAWQTLNSDWATMIEPPPIEVFMSKDQWFGTM